MQASIGGKKLELTTMGFRILHHLANKAPNIVRRLDLELALWKGEPPGSDALRSHIFALRKALDPTQETNRLKTIRGVGYQLIKH